MVWAGAAPGIPSRSRGWTRKGPCTTPKQTVATWGGLCFLSAGGGVTLISGPHPCHVAPERHFSDGTAPGGTGAVSLAAVPKVSVCFPPSGASSISASRGPSHLKFASSVLVSPEYEGMFGACGVLHWGPEMIDVCYVPGFSVSRPVVGGLERVIWFDPLIL